MATPIRLSKAQLKWFMNIAFVASIIIMFLTLDMRLFVLFNVPFLLAQLSVIVMTVYGDPRKHRRGEAPIWPALVIGIFVQLGAFYMLTYFGYLEVISEMGAVGEALRWIYPTLIGVLSQTFSFLLYMMIHEAM